MGIPKPPLDPASLVPQQFRPMVSAEPINGQLKDPVRPRFTDMANSAPVAEQSEQNSPTSKHSAFRNTAKPSFANHSGTEEPNNPLANTLIDPMPEGNSARSDYQGSCLPSAAPRTQVTPKKRASTEPLTITLKANLLRKARILAASKGVTISRLIAGILADAVAHGLPAVVADLQETKEGDDQ